MIFVTKNKIERNSVRECLPDPVQKNPKNIAIYYNAHILNPTELSVRK